MINTNVAISVRGLGKSYYSESARQVVHALRSVTIDFLAEEFVSIIGPSGCGKSTLLSLIAGLAEPSEGEVWIRREDREEGKRPAIGFVFQEPVLLPWRTVWENVRFPLDIIGDRSDASLATLRELVEVAGLSGFERALPRELSGGMRQRASIVRALSYNPRILLMDEPFGALDALTREKMNYVLLDIWSRFRKSVVFVTHDIEEAVFLSDRVVVMTPRPGSIQETIDIRLPRPRTYEVREAPEFLKYCRELRSLLGQEVSGARAGKEVGTT